MAIASTASAYIFFFKWVEIGVYFYLRKLWGFILVVIRNIESRVFAKTDPNCVLLPTSVEHKYYALLQT